MQQRDGRNDDRDWACPLQLFPEQNEDWGRFHRGLPLVAKHQGLRCCWDDDFSILLKWETHTWIREFIFFYFQVCASAHLSFYRNWSHSLRIVQVRNRSTDSFYRGHDLSIRVRRARLTSCGDLIRMCHCHCHCHKKKEKKKLFNEMHDFF